LAIFICVALLFAGIKLYNFTKRNPAFAEPNQYKHIHNYGLGTKFFRFSLYFSDLLGEYLFWTLFGGSAYIFLSYKAQMAATLILPEYGHGSESFYGIAHAIFMMALIFR